MQRYSPYNQYQQVLQNSILVAGIVLIVYEAVILIIYFVGGDAVLRVLNGIFDLSPVPEMGTFSPIILTCFNMMFAVAFLLPVVWFFVWVYKKEHGYQFRRFY